MNTSFKLLPLLKEKNIKKFSNSELSILAQELRMKIIHTQCNNGFLGSCLGVVELAISLHKVFDTDSDIVNWDVGHQTIPYRLIKLFTEHKNDDIDEDLLAPVSIHSCQYQRPAQSLSESIGMMIHRDLEGKDYNIITVIGDRSLSSGQAFEAINHLGAMASKMIIILNDNSSAENFHRTAIDDYLNQLRQNKNFFKQHSLFESLGFNYIGPIDGHNFPQLVETLTLLKNSKEQTPVILHIKTKKGKGYAPAEADDDGLNALVSFEVNSGISLDEKEETSGQIACKALLKQAAKDEKIVLVSLYTPHMQSPFLDFKNTYPHRFFEVGVTEAHAITLASSLASSGFKPYVVFYSSFLHRVLDHSVIDLCLKNLPVRFIIDHTRFTGHDFPSDSKLFDSNFLSYLPNLTIMAPGCADDVEQMIDYSVKDQLHPSVIRLSKTLTEKKYPSISVSSGKARLLKKGSKVAILSYGGLLDECIQAAQLLDTSGLSTSVIDVRFLKPLDEEMVFSLVEQHEYLITVEENAMGTLANHVIHLLNDASLLRTKIHYHSIYINKQTNEAWTKTYSLNAKKIFQNISSFVRLSFRDDDFISVA